MPRVVPSQEVALIDQLFPFAATQREGQHVSVTQNRSGELSALVGLLAEIPSELITLDAPDYAVFVSAVEAARDMLATWRGGNTDPLGGRLALVDIHGLPQLSPVTLIRRMLLKCPDQVPSTTTAALSFIADTTLRESIRLDMSSAYSDLIHGEWKGATVLAGSAVEALLLWALQEHEGQHVGKRALAIASLVGSKTLARPPDTNPERWDLHEYVEIAAQLGIITADTAAQTRLARRFRDLIHIGRAAHLGQKCDRATALGALAAVAAVARDLTP